MGEPKLARDSEGFNKMLFRSTLLRSNFNPSEQKVSGGDPKIGAAGLELVQSRLNKLFGFVFALFQKNLTKQQPGTSEWKGVSEASSFVEQHLRGIASFR